MDQGVIAQCLYMFNRLINTARYVSTEFALFKVTPGKINNGSKLRYVLVFGKRLVVCSHKHGKRRDERRGNEHKMWNTKE